MPRSLITPKRVLLAITALLLVNSFLPLRFAAPVGDVGGGVVKATLRPVTGLLVAMSTTIRPPAESGPDRGRQEELAREYDMAWMLIRKYEAELAAKEEQLQRLTQSKDVLRLKGFELFEVRVTGYSGDRDNPVLTIDRGTVAGVRNRLAVVSEANFVGVVDSDRRLTADVRLITAPGSSVLAKIQPQASQDAARTAEHFLTVNREGTAFIVDVPHGTAITVGDIATVSDSQGQWPPETTGFSIGKVISIKPKDGDNLRFDTVTVKPMIDLPRLSRVTVLKPVEQ